MMVCVIIFASCSLTGTAAHENPHVAEEHDRDALNRIVNEPNRLPGKLVRKREIDEVDV